MFSKLFWIVAVAWLVKVSPSGSSMPVKGVQCVSDIAFTIIAEVFNSPVDIGVRLYCPKGHHCVSQSESPCHPNYVAPTITSTTTPTTTRPTTTTDSTNLTVMSTEASATFLGDITCNGPGYFPAGKCNEYYECAPLYKWFKAILATCKEGYFFSEVNKPCSMPPNVVCTDVS
ncbi:uncharacterized protein [Atheta coriaria]|uniref:uncharacterized protein n=1 Tax=Dalotia coriaria TaxID=877792 RepID=UPI0031F3BC39